MRVCIMAALGICKPKILERYMFERKLKMGKLKRDGNKRYYCH
jgi:hypothetical protein